MFKSFKLLIKLIIISSLLFRPIYAKQNIGKNILKVLGETIRIPIKRMNSRKNKYDADVSLMFADLKYTGKSLKFCEFGGLFGAGAHLNDTILEFFPHSTLSMKSPYWPFAWYYFAKLDLPIWYIGKNPRQVKNHHSIYNAQVMHWYLFEKLNGHYVPNVEALEKDKNFQAKLHSNKYFDPSKLNTYKGIFIVRDSFKTNSKIKKYLKKHYQQFLVVGKDTSQYSINKELGAKVFQENGLKKYKPMWGVFPAVYTPDLARKIRSKIPADLLVVKPLKSMRARGVMVVSRKSLDRVLKLLLPLKRSKNENAFGYWEKQADEKLIIEEYCPSKNIRVRGKLYDPTMRIFFALRCDSNSVYIDVLGGFWKIPEKALGSRSTLTEQHVTIPGNDEWRVGIKIGYADMMNVRHRLKKLLPQLYLNMLDNSSD